MDLLRFIAAMMVLAFHLCFWVWSGAVQFHDGGHAATYHWMDPYTNFGWIGVEVFFVLSGFVISNSAATAMPADFIKNRIIRIYPTVWVCASLSAVSLRLLRRDGLRLLLTEWFHSLLLVLPRPWIDGSYWTLQVELVFYTVVFALLLKSFRLLEPVISLVAMIATVCCVFLAHTAFMASLPSTLLLLHHGQFFALGVLIWLVLFDRYTSLRLITILVCLIGSIAEILSHRGFSEVSTSWEQKMIPVAVWILAVAVIVGSVKGNAHLHRLFGPTGIKYSRKLGLMSYPIYLIHQQVGFAMTGLLRQRIGDYAALGIAVAFILISSFLVIQYVEAPIQKTLRQWLKVNKKSLPAATLP